MKSIVCEQPNQLIMLEGERPALKKGEALVRIRRIGICGTDIHAYKGNQPFFSYPRILGHELSGQIESIADNSYGLTEGDQVSIIPYLECGECNACNSGKTNCCINMKVLGVHVEGGMREWVAVPSDHLVKTNGLSLDQAAMVEPLSIGAHAIRRSQIKQGDCALVIGAGPIGLGVMAYAKQEGANVIAMDVNENRLEFCRKWAGVDHLVNAMDDPMKCLKDVTNGEMPMIVFDATGNTKSMIQAFNYPAHGGKLVYVGLTKDPISFDDPEFHKRELTLLGSRNATREDFEYVVRSLQDNAVDIDSYITHRSTFEEMIDQFEGWLEPEATLIKAVIEL